MDMIHLYRNAVKALDWNGPVFVVGHRSPDCDSVMAALSYAMLMQSLGFDASPRMAGKANRETLFVSKVFGIELPEILERVPRCSLDSKVCEPVRLILVDHNDYAQAVEGVQNARILQVIDHHGLGGISEANLLYSKYMPVGSTCSIIYTSYREFGVKITPEVARILFAGILSDTLNLKKVTATDMDRMIYDDLLGMLALDWCMDKDSAQNKVNEIFAGMVDASHDYSSMSDEEIFNSDAKDYVVGNVKFRLGSLDWKGNAPIDEFAERMLSVMTELAKVSTTDIVFCRVGFKEATYMLYCGKNGKTDEMAKALAEKAFGASIRDGVIFFDRRLSRKLDVVPMLRKIME